MEEVKLPKALGGSVRAGPSGGLWNPAGGAICCCRIESLPSANYITP